MTEPAAGSLAALEYLARMPNTVRAHSKEASLIARTGAALRENGIRQKVERSWKALDGARRVLASQRRGQTAGNLLQLLPHFVLAFWFIRFKQI